MCTDHKPENPEDGRSSFYSNKIILGPMVRVGSLPMRLLSLRYGADLVYTEEIIDFKLIRSHRLVNHLLGTVDFVDDCGAVVFRTCNLEKDKVILQIGTNSPERAVLAAKMVENDVAGIDINMGCPKSFSLKGGMGAALMHKPNIVQQIVQALKANIRKPLSCKIRVFEDLNSTLNLLRIIEQSGADAIAIHGRTKDERPKHPNRNDYIKVAARSLKIPVIANGDSGHINCFGDILEFRNQTQASSVMVSRAAMKNCSVFDRGSQRLKEIDQIIREYLQLAIQYDNNAINTKYCIQQMLGSLQGWCQGRQLLSAYDLKTISDIYGLADYYESILEQWKVAEKNEQQIVTAQTVQNSDAHIELPVVFNKLIFDQEKLPLPKTILNKWLAENKLADRPEYHTSQIEKQFHSVLSFQQKIYSTPYLEKNKKCAEQSAALVLVLKFGLCDNLQVMEQCVMFGNQTPQHEERAQKTMIITNKTKSKITNKTTAFSSMQIEHQGRTYLIKVNK